MSAADRGSAADRALAAVAALAGATGVALSAAATHLGTGATLEIAARFLLIHAAAILGIVALVRLGVFRPTTGRIGGWMVAAGLLLFSGDLATRALAAAAPVPVAAPTGGVLLIAGWLLVALAAVLPGRSV